MTKIHNLACVDPAAKIGKDVEIGPFCMVEGDVEIGDGTRLLSNAVVMNGARIGSNCVVYPGAVIGAQPQDLKFRGEKTVAIIGNGTTIRECATIHRGTASKGQTVVGENCLIMAYCHVAHDCRLGNNIIMSNATQLAGEVVVDDCAVIGGGTLVHQFCHLGSYIMIQGGALINKDIPPYVLAAREPISYTGVNVIGLRRHGFSHDAIHRIQEVYRVLYSSGMNIAEATERLPLMLEPSEELDNILKFIRESGRGVLRG